MDIFRSSAEVYNKSIGPVNERKDNDTDRENDLFCNFQKSHQLISFLNLNKGFLRLTLTDFSGKDLIILLIKMKSSHNRFIGVTNKVKTNTT